MSWQGELWALNLALYTMHRSDECTGWPNRSKSCHLTCCELGMTSLSWARIFSTWPYTSCNVCRFIVVSLEYTSLSRSSPSMMAGFGRFIDTYCSDKHFSDRFGFLRGAGLGRERVLLLDCESDSEDIVSFDWDRTVTFGRPRFVVCCEEGKTEEAGSEVTFDLLWLAVWLIVYPLGISS